MAETEKCGCPLGNCLCYMREAKRKAIYTVTTVHVQMDPFEDHHIVRKRCVGWFPTLELADEAVRENHCDIYECGHYNHAVIETKEPGLYASVTNEFWYKWDKGCRRYLRTSKPDALVRTIHFGMG